ncbi:hypothetical protein F6V25_01320 [Oryzomonas japonica]|uniref:Uncharacterized protein n=1 Tax=Oryzomonas japonica TaxID=2603858 RepID=A0A7J4ZV28_9BACT|nr:hypothetical protein [Oryzomonas japonica]KAB0667370.1 hypothetical protein F6V25_01320 [Oryzomonas japonica]
MRTSFVVSIAAILLMASTAPAAATGDVTGSVPPPQPAVAVGSPNVVIPNPPLFITPPRLGFYAGVETPYDIIFAYDTYYLYWGNAWYRAASYKGPWIIAHHDSLPPIIRKYRIESIRQFRDLEYRTFLKEKNHYRGRSFRPDKR